MKKTLAVLAALLVAGATAWFFTAREPTPDAGAVPPNDAAKIAQAATQASQAKASPANANLPAKPAVTSLTAEEKAARIAKIAKDYEEIMAKAAADFSAAGASFPGGLNAYLRQLALLEREKWKDYAAFLTPRELEDLQFREHTAGKAVVSWLDGTAATDDQRRAVLRLQREFDDKYALIFDMSPGALAAREAERQALQEKILGELGPDLFAAWLRGEGEDFANLARYTQSQGIRPEAALEVWRIKNEFVRRRLELAAQGANGADVSGPRTQLLVETRAKVTALLGAAAIESPRTSGLNWLAAK